MKSRDTLRWELVLFSVLVVLVLVSSVLSTSPAAPVVPPPSPTLAPAATATFDPCSGENLEVAIRDFDKLSREFSDRFVLAQNTPAAQLVSIISEMQDLRRAAEDYDVPACLDRLKDLQLQFMNAAVEACLSLYSSFASDHPEGMTQEQVGSVIAFVQQRVAETGEISTEYTAEMAKLLGVPVPVPTVAFDPVSTQTVTAP